LNGDSEEWASPVAAHAGDSKVGLILIKTGTGIGNLVYTGVQCPHSARIVCSGLYEVGTTINIQVITALDSFTGWKSGPCAGTNNNPCSFVLNNTTTVVAEFTEPQITSYKDLEISIKSSHPDVTGLGSGLLQVFVNKLDYTRSCLNGCRGQFPRGAEVTVIPLPNPDDSVFGGWVHAPSSCNHSSGNCIFNLNEHTALIPIFHKKTSSSTYPLELSVLGAGSIYGPIPFEDGSFDPASEFLIGSEDAGGSPTKILDYQSEGQVLLAPKPKEGWRFKHWNGACSGSGSCSVNMNAAKWVTATFTEESTETDVFYKLIANWTGLGTIKITSNIDDTLSCVAVNRDCSKFYKEDTRVTLTATPEDGWKFSGWEGACSGIGNCTVTMNAAKIVSANFVATGEHGGPTIITLRKVGSGLGSISNGLNPLFSCDAQYTFCSSTLYTVGGAAIPYKAIAESGSIFVGWRSGPCKGSKEPICDIYKNAETINIEAQFDRDPRLSSSCQARHFSDIEEKVQNAYIAFYGRPADVGGLDHWVKELTAAGGDLNLIMDEFGNSDEYRDRFSNMDDRERVNNLYRQLFARPGDDEGLDFYVNEMRKGTFTLASLAINLADGAEWGGDDWKVLEGRRKVARHYVTIMEATPGGKTDFRLADYLASAHESNADAVCDALSKAVFP